MNTKELIDRIFKEPGVKFELTEFENLGKPIHDIITIYPKAAATGKDPTIDSRYFAKFPVPLFADDLAERIQGLVLASKHAQQKSDELLEQAKTRVEQLIEAAVQP